MILADVHSDFLVLRFVATKPELREYKAVYVLSDAEMGDMDLLFAAVARIIRGGATPLPPEGGVPAGNGTPPSGGSSSGPSMTGAFADFQNCSIAVLESPLRRSLFLTNRR